MAKRGSHRSGKENPQQGDHSSKKGRKRRSKRENVFDSVKAGRSLDPEEERQLKVQRRQLLIAAWKARDELYRQLFGDYSYVNPDAYSPPPELKPENVVIDGDHATSGDSTEPGVPGLADQQLVVLAYPPDPLRHYWTYVTAGLSTPWLQDEPSEVSGFGCELMIKSPEDADWAPKVLKAMAYYIFNHAGTLSPGTRIDLNGPIAPHTDSQLTNVFIWYADEAPDCWYQLPSGGFGLFIAVGITDDERTYAESVEEYGTWCIQQVLRQTGHGQITDARRRSVMSSPDIGLTLHSVRMFADTFRTNVAPQDM
ncbi:MAG TPA: suppressor of fused domain protein [Candidatus Obscuribacterales bacterium]